MLNCITIQGRVAKDLELRYTRSGTPVTSYTLAVQRGRKDQSGDYPVDWVDCVAWGKTGEFVTKYFSRGDQMIVRGRLESRDWTDKQGNKRRSWEVQAEQIDFCGPRGNKGAQVDGDDFEDLGDDEDVPF